MPKRREWIICRFQFRNGDSKEGRRRPKLTQFEYPDCVPPTALCGPTNVDSQCFQQWHTNDQQVSPRKSYPSSARCLPDTFRPQLEGVNRSSSQVEGRKVAGRGRGHCCNKVARSCGQELGVAGSRSQIWVAGSHSRQFQ